MTGRLARILGRRRSGLVSLEAILAFPMILTLFAAVSQVLITAQARNYVEAAAYAAARSALVHKCLPDDIELRLVTRFAVPHLPRCSDNARKWTDAARWALVPASATSGFSQGRGCPQIRAGSQIVRGTGKLSGHDEALSNAICYAFEPQNVEVDVEWVRTPQSYLNGTKTLAVRATVRFRYPLATPFRRFVKDGKRGDGTYWRWGEASVELS